MFHIGITINTHAQTYKHGNFSFEPLKGAAHVTVTINYNSNDFIFNTLTEKYNFIPNCEGRTTALKDTPPAPLVNNTGLYPHTYQLQKMDLVGYRSFGKGGICREAGNGMGVWDIKKQGLFSRQSRERWLQKWGLHLFPLLHLEWMRRKPPKPVQPKRRVPASQSYGKLPYQYLWEDKQVHAVPRY